jgi:hypothetical protein
MCVAASVIHGGGRPSEVSHPPTYTGLGMLVVAVFDDSSKQDPQAGELKGKDANSKWQRDKNAPFQNVNL